MAEHQSEVVVQRSQANVPRSRPEPFKLGTPRAQVAKPWPVRVWGRVCGLAITCRIVARRRRSHSQARRRRAWGQAKPPRRSLVLARSGHIHLSTFGPEQPTRSDTILRTTRQILNAVVLCLVVGFGPTRRRVCRLTGCLGRVGGDGASPAGSRPGGRRLSSPPSTSVDSVWHRSSLPSPGF